jgi:P2 family phage contractile tail tube protein|nr:MAG TPA: tail tube protein [Caudoviricetes sp.]
MIEIKKISNANVYKRGVSFVGKAKEITLPDVSFIANEYKALGLFGTAKLPDGLEAMEATFIWGALYPEVLSEAANPYTAVPLQIRAAQETFNSFGRVNTEKVLIDVVGTFSKFPLGAFKPGEALSCETTMQVSYFKMQIGRQVIAECDVLANIYRVNGINLLTEI